MLFLLLFTFFLTPDEAANTHSEELHIEYTDDEEFKGTTISFFRDSTQNISIHELKTGKIDSLFTFIGEEVPNFGITDDVVWGKFQLSNHSDHLLYLKVDYPMIDSLILYKVTDNQIVQKQKSGWSYPFSIRDIPSPNLILKLEISPGESAKYYFKVRSQEAITLPIQIGRIDKFLIEENKMHMFQIALLAVMLGMMFYNIFLFASTKEIIFIEYAIYVGAQVMLQMMIKGYGYAYLWPEAPEWNLPVTYSATIISGIFAIIFTDKLLNLKKVFPQARIYLKFLGSILSIYLFGIWLGYDEFFHQFLQRTNVFGTISLLIIAIVAFFKKQKQARFYLIAWTAFLTGVNVWLFKNWGLLPHNLLTENAILIGASIEVILLSMALANRLNELKKEKAEAQKAMMKSLKEKQILIQEQNEMLEQKVKERTHELYESREEITQQRDQIVLQKNIAEEQKQKLEQINYDMLSSINYARRIQQAMLPDITTIQAHFPESFIMFKPKDVVSGDFYWFSTVGKYRFFAVIDCTGHGVPGGFMSMIGHDILDTLINQNRITAPDKILELMDQRVTDILRQDVTHNQDGMDVSLCVYDTEEEKLHFAGARHSLLYVREGEPIQYIKGNRKSIGGDIRKEIPFNCYEISLDSPTTFYLYSDGLQDQFGGLANRKFSSKRLKELLNDISSENMEFQQDILERSLKVWQGDQPQIDDILLVGFKLPVQSEKRIEKTTTKGLQHQLAYDNTIR